MVGRNFLEHPAINHYDVLAPSSDELNLLDYNALDIWLKSNNPELIIHAAGRVGGIQANIADPSRFLLENLDMGRNIVWSAFNNGVKRLINLGSSCMYPRGAVNPLREEIILTGELEPSNEGYAIAKITVARLCDYITRQYSDFNYKTLIPCNIYGRHDSFDPARSHLLPAVIHKIHQAHANGSDCVDIWGDGTAKREFMYAGDLADALVTAIKRFDDLPQNMNVGLGYDYMINEYYQAVADVVGYQGGFVHDLSKPVGMARKLICVDRQKIWGWQAQCELARGIELTYEYYLSNKNDLGV